MGTSFFFERALTPQGWARDVRVETDGAHITAVTPGAAAQARDQREAVAMPGLPDLHSHAFQRAMAGLAERRGPSSDNFWTWREAMYRFVGTMGPDEVEAIAAYAFMDMLEGGFTTVGEFHYVHRRPDGGAYDDPAELALRHIAAAHATGLGITLLPVLYAASNFGGAPPTEGQKRFITNADSFADIMARAEKALSPADRIGLAPHSLRAVPPELLAFAVELAGRRPIHIHASEQTKEVEDCLAWSGQRPVEWLLSHAPVDARWCLVHATHTTEAEVRALAATGATAGLCPTTESNLGDGVFPAQAYLAAGGGFGVGTDSNIEMDAAAELRQLEYAQRLTSRARNILAAPNQPSTGLSLYQAALKGGAKALDRPAAAIAPGGAADFVTLNAANPDIALRGEGELLDTWCFSVGRRAIDKVIVGGRTLVEGGRHKDRAAIAGRYLEAASKLLDA